MLVFFLFIYNEFKSLEHLRLVYVYSTALIQDNSFVSFEFFTNRNYVNLFGIHPH